MQSKHENAFFTWKLENVQLTLLGLRRLLYSSTKMLISTEKLTFLIEHSNTIHRTTLVSEMNIVKVSWKWFHWLELVKWQAFQCLRKQIVHYMTRNHIFVLNYDKLQCNIQLKLTRHQTNLIFLADNPMEEGREGVIINAQVNRKSILISVEVILIDYDERSQWSHLSKQYRLWAICNDFEIWKLSVQRLGQAMDSFQLLGHFICQTCCWWPLKASFRASCSISGWEEMIDWCVS